MEKFNKDFVFGVALNQIQHYDNSIFEFLPTIYHVLTKDKIEWMIRTAMSTGQVNVLMFLIPYLGMCPEKIEEEVDDFWNWK